MKAPDPTLDTLWKHVLDHWDKDAAHHAFLDYCHTHEALDEAAVRYRGMKGDRDRGPGADKRLAAVLMLAMSKLEVSRSEPKAASRSWIMLGLIVFFLGGSLIVLMYLLRS